MKLLARARLVSLASLLSLVSLSALSGCNARGADANGRAPAPTPGRPAATETIELSSLPSADHAAVLIKDVPHVRQKPDFCGEACVEMALLKLGRPLSQDTVFHLSGVDPALGRGAYTSELRTAMERAGFEPGKVFFPINPSKAEKDLSAQFAALHADLMAGIPSIVCMHYSDSPRTTEHFRLILGYDPKTDEVIYNEPAEDDGGYRRMRRPLFLKYGPSRGARPRGRRSACA